MVYSRGSRFSAVVCIHESVMHMGAGRVNFYIHYGEVMPVYYSEILIIFCSNTNFNLHLAAGKWLGSSGLLDHV